MLTQHGNDILQLSHSAGRPRSIAPLSPCSARAGRPAERRGAKVLCVTTRGVRLRSPSEPIGAHPAWVLGGGGGEAASILGAVGQKSGRGAPEHPCFAVLMFRTEPGSVLPLQGRSCESRSGAQSCSDAAKGSAQRWEEEGEVEGGAAPTQRLLWQ